MDRTNGSTEEEPLVGQIAEEIIERQRRGERPTVEEYCEKFPVLESKLRAFLPALIAVENVKEGSTYGQDNEHPSSAGQTIPKQIGDFRVLSEIGRGGMGVVYEAEQLSLGRRVALKVLAHSSRQSPTAVKRFESEARAAAKMHHTNIVPVFDVGADEHWSYYAMQLIRGQSLDLVIKELARLRRQEREKNAADAGDFLLDEDVWTKALSVGEKIGGGGETRLDKTRGGESATDEALSDGIQSGATTKTDLSHAASDPFTQTGDRRSYYESIARIGHQIAEGLAYAHARGIVHRDIKPSNLLLDANGIVWITDFGLAKSEDSDLTRSGDVPGTVRYMSPERFKGRCDVRADVYALGLTIYELLTLQPAFSATDQLSLIDRIANADPSPPRSMDAHLPRDLETIVLKAIEKEPRSRYQSADAIAADLLRFCNDEPIRARRSTITERCVRWSRRNKALAGSLAVVTLLLVGITIGSLLLARHFRERQLSEAQVAGENALLAKEKSRLAREMVDLAEAKSDYLYVAHMQSADRSLREGSIDRLRELLDEHIPSDGELDRRSVEWFFLDHVCNLTKAAPTIDYGDIVTSVDVSPGGKRIVATGDDGKVKLFDVTQEEMLAAFEPKHRRIHRLLISPRGDLVFAIHSWKYEAWKISPQAEGDFNAQMIESGDLFRPGSAEMSHSDQVFVAATAKTRITRWDLSTTELAKKHIDFEEKILDFQLLGGGETFFVSLADGSLRHCRFGDDGMIETLVRSDNPAERICISEDQRHVVSLGPRYLQINTCAPSDEGRLSIDSSPDAILRMPRPEGRVDSLIAFQSSFALVGESAISTYRYNGELGGLLRLDGDFQLTKDRSGKYLSITPADGVARVYSALDLKVIKEFKGHRNTIYATAFADDGRLVTGSRDNTIRIFDEPADTQSAVKLAGHRGWIWSVAFSPNSNLLATSAYDSDVMIWNGHMGENLRRLTDHEASVQCVSFSPDGKWLASGSRDKTIKLWDTESFEKMGELLGHEGAVNKVRFSPDGKSIASAGDDGTVRVWDIQTKAMLGQQRVEEGMVWSLGFASDEELVFGGTDDRLYRWRWQSEDVPETIHQFDADLTSIAFSPDGVTLACTTADGVITVIDYSQRTIEATPIAHRSDAMSVAFSHDGKSFLSAGADGQVRFWSTKTLEPTLRIQGHNDHVHCIAVSPDGTRFATGSFDDTAKLWTISE